MRARPASRGISCAGGAHKISVSRPATVIQGESMRCVLYCAVLAVALFPFGHAKAQMPMIINDAIAATVSSERAAVKIDPAPEGQAQIVFYRKRPFFGNKEIFALSEGGNEFAQLRFGQYAVHVIEPGTRQFALAAGGEALELQAQAGQTYYVEGELVKAEGGKRQSLKRVDEDQFRKVSFQLMKLETKAAE
ncbi:hypothetical protein [Lysobacter gummosus]|uniref:DUF2846 domain-containing protein n=1 Tax=Lysobacter gummosus TaxID=262324 RepID=A0ABY3XBI1_9GAMM|nr:hypothetical protein [Lysobacter gummosus]UNP28796.1 DUF2846 domain-containing protein [Lysobacter gummosus]